MEHDPLLQDALRAARKRAGYTQEELAELLGCTRLTVTAHENGGRSPDPSTIYKIAQVLELTEDELDDLLRLRAGAPLRDRPSSDPSTIASSAAA